MATGYRISTDRRLPSQTAKPRGRRRPDPLQGVLEGMGVPLRKESGEIRPVAAGRELLRREPGTTRSCGPGSGAFASGRP